jgi:tight adherence protein C
MDSILWNSSTALFAGAVAAAGAAGFVLGLMVLPSQRHVHALGDYHAASRAKALAESRMLKLLWPLVELGAQYAMMIKAPGLRAGLAKLLRDAGGPLDLDVDELLGLAFAGTAVGLAFAFVFNLGKGVGNGLYLVGGGMGLFAPFMWLTEMGKDRFKMINRGLPQALDLIVMAMGAGLDFTGSLRHVVERWSDKRDWMYLELHRFLHELNLGKTRREGLEDLAERAPTQVVRTFVANVLQAEQRGTPLVEILQIQAEVARSQRFQAAEKAAGRAGVVILMPMMLIFAAVMLVLFGGVIVKFMRGGLTS